MTEEPRLKTRLRVQAVLRRLDGDLVPAAVRRSGDPDAGALLVKVDRRDGTASVFSQTRDMEGRPAWLAATGPEPVADADAESYIARELRFDPDLWVVEVEDPSGRNPFDETTAAAPDDPARAEAEKLFRR